MARIMLLALDGGITNAIENTISFCKFVHTHWYCARLAEHGTIRYLLDAKTAYQQLLKNWGVQGWIAIQQIIIST